MLQKKEFALSAALSSTLHILALLFLQTYSFWSQDAPGPVTDWNPLPKEQMLRTAFERLSKCSLEKNSVAAIPLIQESLELRNDLPFLQREEVAPFRSPQFESHLDPTHLYATNDAVILHPPPSTLDLFVKTPDFAPFPQPQMPSPPLLAPQPHPEAIVLNVQPLVLPEPVNAKIKENPLTERADLPDIAASKRVLLSIPTPPLPSFPTLEQLETTSYSENFDLEISCEPKEDESGYLFALTLIPQTDLKLVRIRQHYTFLIDRSNSIQRERLLETKNAVLKAIKELAPEDTFNVFVFDSRVEKLFPTSQPVNPNTIAHAKAFLEPIQLGSFFTPASLYAPLVMTLPGQITLDEVHTAILLSDGENFSKKAAARALLNEWTWQNNGNVSLFTIGMDCDRHLSALEAISAFNRGKLLYSPTKGGIKRKLLKLMKNVHTPLAKNVTCKIIGGTEVELLPAPDKTPHLYADQPFVILGSVKTLDDFTLFVQGRLKGRWMNIKKTISFLSAKSGGTSLKREWALQRAFQCYEKYVHDDNPAHLEAAAAHLAPYNIELALQ